MSIDDHIKVVAIKKAKQSVCRYKISAIGLNRNGDVICKSTNKSRFSRIRGGLHAEMEVMKKCGLNLKTIIITRINNSGDLLPIDPCPMCKQKADELGIKIVSIKE